MKTRYFIARDKDKKLLYDAVLGWYEKKPEKSSPFKTREDAQDWIDTVVSKLQKEKHVIVEYQFIPETQQYI